MNDLISNMGDIAIFIAIAGVIVNILLFIAIICTANNTERTNKELLKVEKQLEELNKQVTNTNLILMKNNPK